MPTIRMVRIVPQVIKVRGVEVEVNCKQICYFPMTDAKGVLTGFGRLQNAPWQVCIQRANWGDAIVKIRYNDKSGRFSIIFNEQQDPIDPWDRRRKVNPDRTTCKVVNRTDNLTTDGIERELARICKGLDPSLPADQQPVDHEFIETVLGELIMAAESARKAA